jgi:3-deoxy-D-manno-octulosonic-acid transferase
MPVLDVIRTVAAHTMISLYRLLTYAGSTLVVPALCLRAIGDVEGRVRLRERLGRISRRSGVGSCLWIQAVSVGEVRTAETLVAALRKSGLSAEVALSATTAAGLDRARALDSMAPEVFTFPLDLPVAVRRTLDALRPSAFGSIETEIWPGLLAECGARGIPAFIANGSISERSARRYRLIGSAVREGLQAVRAACMQSEEDASRVVALGARSGSVVVSGNMKFDSAPHDLEERASRLSRDLALPPGRPVMIAGSTSPGEEPIVAEAWSRARAEIPGLILIVAPRHRDRFDAAASAMASNGAAPVRRSRCDGTPRDVPSDAILLDTIGELEAAYTLAKVAFVGGSLVPRGGQNPLEPARAGVPVLFGPGMPGFREVADRLLACGGAFEVTDAASLAARAIAILADPSLHERASRAAKEFVASHAGATEKTLLALSRLIPEVFAKGAA